MMNRRRFLTALGLGAAGAAAVAVGCGLSLEDGLFHPCPAAPLPRHLVDHEAVRAAWQDIDPADFRDCHVHVAGIGDGHSGVWVTPRMTSLLHPWQNLQRRFYLNAACVRTEGRVDEDYIRRLMHYLEAFPAGGKVMLLAFDFNHDESGAERRDLSTFRISDGYAAELAQLRPERFEWVCSIHPYRRDALQALDWAVRHGARAVKWLPSAMGMDPASPRCDGFYDALVRANLPLLSHGGGEQAVHGGRAHEYNNPLRLRRPLDRGVRVIVAHCASLGEHPDIDEGPDGPRLAAFALFGRLMDEARYEKQLYGDISGLTQINRAGMPLSTVLARESWHTRLIHGSDYPLPAVVPLVSLRRFVEEGYLGEQRAATLAEIRRYNPLLFDFVLKRSLTRDGRRWPPAVFASRRLFG